MVRTRIGLAGTSTDELPVDARRFVWFGDNDVESSAVVDAGSELDVRASAGHVGRDGDGPLLSCPSDNVGLLTILHPIEQLIGDAEFIELPGKLATLFDRPSTDQHRLSRCVDATDVACDGSHFGRFVDKRAHGQGTTTARSGERDANNPNAVEGPKLPFIARCGTGHSAESLIESEIPLS